MQTISQLKNKDFEIEFLRKQRNSQMRWKFRMMYIAAILAIVLVAENIIIFL